MTEIITIDFETYYDKTDFSLSKMETEAYIRDPRFEVIGVSVMRGNTTAEWFSGTRVQTREWLLQFDFENNLALSHNAHFDMAILNWHFGIKPKGYLDTVSMANALHGINNSVSLANLVKLYGLPDKGTEVHDANGKKRADFTPEQLAAYGKYCELDVHLCRLLFDLMAPSFVKSELKLIDLTIRMFVEPRLELDLVKLEEYLIEVRDDQAASLERITAALAGKGVAEGNTVKDVLMSNAKFASLLQYLGVEPPLKVSPTTGKMAYAFAKTDKEFTELLEHENVTVQAAVAARLGNKTTIEESRTKAFIAVAKRGLFPFPLKYSGASVTHRWSGFDYNVQNMKRGGTLRSSIVAPAGYKIVAADLSNIELRLGLYLAEQTDKIQLIEEGRDLYMDVASIIFNKSYEEIEALGKKSKERTTGKVVSLASIYGTGATKLRETLRIMGKVQVSEEAAQSMTDIYRGSYVNVVNAWAQGKDILDALYHGHDAKCFKEGILTFTSEGLVKPCGLALTYPDLAWTPDDKGKMGYTYAQKRGARDRVYGSKVFQRCTQSLARDIIGEHILAIDKKYRVVGTVHDEIICLVPDAEVKEAEAFMLSVMRTAPAWAQGLPLDAEVASGNSYGDAK